MNVQKSKTEENTYFIIEDNKLKGKIIANEFIYNSLEESAIEQLKSVSTLPGIINPVIGMPDMHFGYGVPVGTVAIFDKENGIISAGMTGFDINCGLRLLKTNKFYKDIKDNLKEIGKILYDKIPVGLGSKSKIDLTDDDLKEVLTTGVNWAIKKGYAKEEIKNKIEEEGCMPCEMKISDKALKRGRKQLETLGSGNHFLEIQQIEELYDEELSKKYNLKEDQIMIMIHTGSRGLGHQVATDFLNLHEKAVKKYNINIPDKQLVCAPINSKEGKDYFEAMKCASNFAFVNRTLISFFIEKELKKMDFKLETIYDVAHNIAKFEKLSIPIYEYNKIKNEFTIKDSKMKKVLIHRKGATRAYPNLPVIIAGSMGTASYLLEGTEDSFKHLYGSACHGAGRALSRTKAKKEFDADKIKQDLEEKGKVIRATSSNVITEEAPLAYKNVDEVIKSMKPYVKIVAKLKPLVVIKG
jgi:tRNA-splicing ligase RtcB